MIGTLQTFYDIFFENFDVLTNIFCTMYHPTSHQVIMQITSIYMVLQNYLNYEIFNDTIFAMIKKIKKILGRNTFNLLYLFNCEP